MPGLIDEDPGELLQQLGEQGARRAKLWLDSTTRVASSWSVYDGVAVNRLKYPWPHGGRGFSYDLGGILHGGDLDQQAFLVECKKYATDNQGAHFDKFLAQSYVTLRDYPHLADHFMWITWHPFRVTTWNKVASSEAIRLAIIAEGKRVFNDEDPVTIVPQIDPSIVDDLAARIWIIVLSDRQESLVISKEDRAEVMRLRTLNS